MGFMVADLGMEQVRTGGQLGTAEDGDGEGTIPEHRWMGTEPSWEGLRGTGVVRDSWWQRQKGKA